MIGASEKGQLKALESIVDIWFVLHTGHLMDLDKHVMTCIYLTKHRIVSLSYRSSSSKQANGLVL